MYQVAIGNNYLLRKTGEGQEPKVQRSCLKAKECSKSDHVMEGWKLGKMVKIWKTTVR